MSRPRILIPARFSESASALRFRAEVNARALITAVFAAGGEPLTIHPSAPEGFANNAEIADRFNFVDGVLLPGGGDILPSFYGGDDHEELYDMDAEQDAFDLAIADWALRTGRPVLAICRGLQVANVARGGTLLAHMDEPHRHVTTKLTLDDGSQLSHSTGIQQLTISCHHHQALARLGNGMHAAARSSDGVIEAVEMRGADDQWFLGVQWHPEDTAATDPAQQAIFADFMRAATAFGSQR